MNETDAKSAIQSSKRILPDDPMNPRNVGRVLGDPDSVVVRDAKNPHQMQVIQGGRATVVHMRQKASDSPKLAAGQRKEEAGPKPVRVIRSLRNWIHHLRRHRRTHCCPRRWPRGPG